MSSNGGTQPVSAAARRPLKLEPGTHSEPEFPILDVREFGGIVADKRYELASAEQLRLRDDEIVVHVHRGEIKLPKTPVTPRQILMKATNAAIPAEIGYNGPSVASVSMKPGERRSRYERQHGRDDLYAALDVFDDYPKLLDTSVVSLAGTQGMNREVFVSGQPYGFEQPGSIILVNFDPRDPLGQKFLRNKLWKKRFYGSCDAPGLFVDAISRLHTRYPNYLSQQWYKAIDGSTHDIGHAFKLSIGWLTDRIDSNAQGLIEYKNPFTDGRGMRHQGWKDHFDSMVHKDGSLVDSKNGVAPIEIQCQAIISLRKAAKIYRDYYQNTEFATGLEKRADALLEYILNDGWVSNAKGGYFAMGWERDEHNRVKRIETKSIDMHWVLRVLDMNNQAHKELAFHTVETLAHEDMLTRWGSRVMSNSENGYGDFRYHCGVWFDKHNREVESFSSIGLYGLDRHLGGYTTNQMRILGCVPEYITGIDAEYPVFPTIDLYVYNPVHNELYLAEQIPPLFQTWGATSEIAKCRRYARNPMHARNRTDRDFERQLISKLSVRYC